jgi:RNA polymerase sigma-70 factor (ECF subfamily)
MTDEQVHRLIAEHYQYVFRVVYKFVRRREDAEDVMQEAVILAMTKHDQLKDESKFRAWFAALAVNKALSYLSRSKWLKHERIDELLKPISYETKFEDNFFYKDAQIKLAAKACDLPPRQSMAYDLRVNKGLDFKEIAEKMGCGYNTAKTHARLATMKIKGTH